MLKAKSYADILTNYVRAGRENSSSQVLAKLASSEVARIRVRVGENPKTPIEVLEVLATDRNADVRIAVGTNPSTPTHISYGLTFDEDPSVRLGLAEDLSTPIELLNKLIEDANPYVSCRAKETKELILSQGQPNDHGCHRFFRWATQNTERTDFRYA